MHNVFYTLVPSIEAWRHNDIGGRLTGKPTWELHYQAMIAKFGGSLFTKEQWIEFHAQLMRQRPGYLRQGGNPGYEYQAASRSWSWWTKRHMIFRISI